MQAPISVRLSDEAHDELKIRASGIGLGPSTYARQLIEGSLGLRNEGDAASLRDDLAALDDRVDRMFGERDDLMAVYEKRIARLEEMAGL